MRSVTLLYFFTAKIVIAEDNDEHARMVRDYLLTDKHEIAIVADASQLYVAIRESAPDMMILDFQMPGGGAPGAVKSIRGTASLSNIPVLIISSMPVEQLKKWLGSVPSVDFLAKPFKAAELRAAVDKMLGR
jgi:DNA-binding response OmpR family regulator